jgi:uncharacterized DUF497 family protein
VSSWDTAKAVRDFKKHGVTFEEAATVFSDPEALDWLDASHWEDEPRSKRLGRSVEGRVLLAIYTLPRTNHEKETVRIINARQASCRVRKTYAG